MTAGKGPVEDDGSAHPADMAHRSSRANPRRQSAMTSRRVVIPLYLFA
jgi:hypothetical protein